MYIWYVHCTLHICMFFTMLLSNSLQLLTFRLRLLYSFNVIRTKPQCILVYTGEMNKLKVSKMNYVLTIKKKKKIIIVTSNFLGFSGYWRTSATYYNPRLRKKNNNRKYIKQKEGTAFENRK